MTSIHEATAKPLLPRLRQLQVELANCSQASRLQEEMEYLRVMIEELEVAEGTVELYHLFGDK